MGVPPNGWFTKENQIKWTIEGGTPIFGTIGNQAGRDPVPRHGTVGSSTTHQLHQTLHLEACRWNNAKVRLPEKTPRLKRACSSSMHVYVCMYVRMYVCIYVCMYI